MSEDGKFTHGDVTLPLTSSTGRELLEDADPALAAILAFVEWLLEFEIGARLAAEAPKAGKVHIPKAVGTATHVEALPAVFADRLKFPFLSIWRETERQLSHTVVWDKSVGTWRFAYVLPALMPDTQARLQPILRLVPRILARALRTGSHPGYQDGAAILADAGVMSARLVSARYEEFTKVDPTMTEAKYFRAVTGELEVVERDNAVPAELSTSPPADTANTTIDLNPQEAATPPEPGEAPAQPVPPDPDDIGGLNSAGMATVLNFTVYEFSPVTGSMAGGEVVIFRGMGFRPGTQVHFQGYESEDVTVVSESELRAVTPPLSSTTTTFLADVTLTAPDGQVRRMPATFLFGA